MSNQLNVKLLTSFESFEKLREDWNKILNESGSNAIFLTWEWLYTWAEHFVKDGRELFLIAVHQNNQLIGIAPWYINPFRYGPFKLRRIEFLGAPETGSDYLDVIVKKGKEKTVASKIYDYLMGEFSSKWDWLFLRESPSNSVFFLNYIKEFEKEGKFIEVKRGAFCPVLDLCDTREEFLASLSANRRQQLRRHYRVLSKGAKVQHEKYRDVDSIDALVRFSRLYQKRWDRKEEDLFQFLEKFACRAKGKNWVQIDMLKADDIDVAGIVHLFYNGVTYYYLMAVDKYYNPKVSIGNILLSLCIQDAVENKFSRYDFLKGDEFHKFHWANHGMSLYNVEHFRRNIGTAAVFAVQSLRKLGKILLR